MRRRQLVPLLLFATVVALLAVGLRLDPRVIPSPLLQKPAPVFALPNLHEPSVILTDADLRGRVVLLNVWASWCVSCRLEHALLMEVAGSGRLAVYGLNYKDQRDDALRWLGYYGDPYVASALDAHGRVAIDFGVYGVPETFVIDGAGLIRYKHIGPIDRDTLDKSILPLVEQLEKGRA